MTDFRPDRLRYAPGTIVTGLRLRLGWYAMRGAVGMRLWWLPHARRSGAISVWTSEDALQSFVGLPVHVEIMRRYGKRGSLRSVTWTAAGYEPAEILRRARQWIAA